MVPPRRKKSEHSLDILRGKCPTTTPPFVIAMHDFLRSSSMIVHVLVNNNNLFPCLEIIGVLNFRTDARIRKFFDAKISYPKIFGHENFRIYGIVNLA